MLTTITSANIKLTGKEIPIVRNNTTPTTGDNAKDTSYSETFENTTNRQQYKILGTGNNAKIQVTGSNAKNNNY